MEGSGAGREGLIGALMGHRLVAIVASVVGREGSWDVDPSWERRRQRRWHVEQWSSKDSIR